MARQDNRKMRSGRGSGLDVWALWRAGVLWTQMELSRSALAGAV
jgi:hypothetical protein